MCSQENLLSILILGVANISQQGPLTAYVNSGAFLPLSDVSNRTDELVDQLLAQDPAEYLPANVPETVLEGYKTQIHVISELLKSRGTGVIEMPFSGRPSFSIILLKPLSRGQIRLSSSDDGVSPTGRGNEEPIVDWRSYTNPIDLEFVVDFLKWARWFAASPAMVETFDPVEVRPGPTVEDDESIKAWLKGVLSPSNGHLVGTAALGPLELGGVVGPDLTVHGVDGLSIADNSIITIIPGTHTSSTAYAIGEKVRPILSRNERDNLLIPCTGCRSGVAKGQGFSCLGGALRGCSSRPDGLSLLFDVSSIVRSRISRNTFLRCQFQILQG